MKQNDFPPGWDEERVRRVLVHYEEQTEAEAVAEDEAAFEDSDGHGDPHRVEDFTNGLL
jgi:hypothetical protein